jgi:hypothetical protein
VVVGNWVATTRSEVVGLAAAVLTLAAALFSGLMAAVDFSLGFLGPGVSLVEITVGCVSDSVTG